MRLNVPASAPRLEMTDIYDQPVSIGNSQRRTLLCFFRGIYELTRHHADLARLGLDIVAVFSSSPDAVKRFVARQPRPFQVVADPSSKAHTLYGIERSFWRKLKGIVTRVPTLLKGMRIVGLAGLNTSNLMPADFLIDEQGRIIDAYYGDDAGDHIPFERIELFIARGLLQRHRA